MSYLIAPVSGERIDVFGQGGGERTANAMSVPYLGELPLDPKIRIGGDTGKPVALDPAGRGAAFIELAERVVARLVARGVGKTPTLTVSD